VVLLGPPGAGKGTQARALAARLRVPHLSTGEMFRDHVARGTELGARAKAIMEAGDLIPDEMVNEMVAGRLRNGDCGAGFVLDGYPRTVEQARILDQLLTKRRRRTVVIHLRVEYNELIQRLTGRRSCPKCGRIYNTFLQPPVQEGMCDLDGAALARRHDDDEYVVRERLAAYVTQTRPLVDHYRRRKTFFDLDGSRPTEEITQTLDTILRAGDVGRAGA